MSLVDTVRNAFVPIRPEGYPFIAGFAVVTVFLGLFSGFLFWIGLILVAASLGTLVQAARSAPDGPKLFVSWPQLRLVLSVLVPTIIYVAAIPALGIYLASALLVAYCMVALGGFAWWRAALAGLAAALVVFVTFEIWFLVALPKGPLEAALGY